MENNDGRAIEELVDWLNKGSETGRAGEFISGYISGVIEGAIKAGITDISFKWELKTLHFDDEKTGAYRVRIHTHRNKNPKATSSIVMFYSVFQNGKIGELFLSSDVYAKKALSK